MKAKNISNSGDFPDARLGGREYISILQSILYNSPTGVALLDVSFHFILMNDSLASMLGTLKASSVGKTVDDLIPWATKELFKDMKSVISNGKPKTNIEISHTEKGTIRYFSVSLYPCKNRASQIIGIGFMMNETTDLVISKKQVESGNKRFRILIEKSSEIISLINKQGEFQYTSPSTETILGYKPKDLINTNSLSLIHKEDLPFVQKTLKSLVSGANSKVFITFRMIHKNGTPRWMEGSGTNLLADPEVNAIVANYHDITDRKIFEENLKQKTEELIKYSSDLAEANVKNEAILNSVGEGLIVTDELGKILLVNAAAENMLKIENSAVTGKPLANIVIMFDSKNNKIEPQARPIIQALESGKKIITKDYLYQRSDKSKFPVHTTTTPIQLKGKIAGTIVVFRDVTQEKAIDRAKSEFVSLASHQLRTPLTIIKWFTARLLAAESSKMSESAKLDYIEKIYKTNERMVELVNAILNVSRVETGTLSIQPQQVNIQATCESVLSEYSTPIQNKKLNIKTQFSKKIPIITIDPELLRIIFLNLLSNAIKYTPEKGTISIKLDSRDDKVSVEFKDTGVGMSLEQQEQLFTKFFRTEQARQIDPEGNGLGLYIIKSILQEIGGTISISSEKNKGTSFTVLLPEKSINKKGNSTLIESKA